MTVTEIGVNVRSLQAPQSGIQTYARELLRLESRDHLLHRHAPAPPRAGIVGHLWEQLVLPRQLHGNLLWSPSNTGPLAVKHQVVTVHDVVPLDHPEWLTKRFAAWYRFLTPRLARRVQHVLTISEFSKQRILHHTGMDPNRLTVIPNGVGERFHPEPSDLIQEVRNKYGIESQRYVLSLSTLEPRKNVGRVLLAWKKMQPTLSKDVQLIIAGERGRSTIFRDVGPGERPPGVQLAGRISEEDLPALYSGATAFVYPSLYEGFGLPPLEAMACGTPVLSSNTTSIPEVVGDAGILVDPTDAQAISDGLTRILTDDSLLKELSRKGLERAKRFTWEQAARRTWTILEQEARR